MICIRLSLTRHLGRLNSTQWACYRGVILVFHGTDGGNHGKRLSVCSVDLQWWPVCVGWDLVHRLVLLLKCHQRLLMPLRDRQWLLRFWLAFDLVRRLSNMRNRTPLAWGQLPLSFVSFGFVRFQYCRCRSSGTRSCRGRCWDRSGLGKSLLHTQFMRLQVIENWSVMPAASFFLIPFVRLVVKRRLLCCLVP